MLPVGWIVEWLDLSSQPSPIPGPIDYVTMVAGGGS